MTRLLLTGIVLLAFCCGCSPNKSVAITDEGTGVSLKYDCSNFVSQAKGGADMNAIRRRANEVLKRANQEGNKVLSRSIHAARESNDVLRLEELAVKDECAHLK